MKRVVYVPIVKGKKNDIVAVGSLSEAVRSVTKPLIEAMPMKPKKPQSLEEHIYRFCDYICKHVPLGQIFVDFYGLMPDACVDEGTNGTLFGFQILRGLGREATPVYGLERNDDIWDGLANVVAASNKGFAFRLRYEDLAEDLIPETWGAIIERSAQIGVSESQVDLILDFASLSRYEPDEIKETVISFLFHNPRVHLYRSIVVAASSALKDVSGIEKEDMTEVRRGELYLWSDLWNDMPDGVKPIYGDYGVVHPDFSDIGPNQNMNAKIRYTVGDKILYFRGHGLLRPQKDFGQYYDLAKRVTADRRCKTRDHSVGDTYLHDCARRLTKTPGSPATWVRADMNHHVTYVAQQVRRLVDEFASLPDATDAASLLSEV